MRADHNRLKKVAGRIKVAVALFLVVALAAGCDMARSRSESLETAHAPSPAQGAESARIVTIDIANFAFQPSSVTVAPGTRVIFVNRDATPHNVVQGTASEVTRAGHKPRFESPELGTGDRWEIVLDEPGEYRFVCTVAGHYLMGMAGTIVVAEEAAQGSPTRAAGHGAGTPTASGDAPYPGSAGAAHAHHRSAAAESGARESAPSISWTPEGLSVLEPFRVDGRVKEFAIDIQEVTHEIVDGVEVTAWAFNGTLPGPLLRVTEGDLVRVHFTNTHHQPHTIHWHGLYVDQKHDGVPHTSRAVMPGETYVYEFEADRPGTFMYHCHVDSYRHIDMGMYGGIVVEPKGEKPWDREYTLILDDWDTNVDPLAPHYEPEHNHFLVNGKAFPSVPALPLKVGETTLVRLINAGYSNFAMHLHGPHFEVVATDGHPLPAPYAKDTLDIAPGERYEILIRPTKAGQYPFHAHNIQYVRNNGAYPGGLHLMFDIVDESAAK